MTKEAIQKLFIRVCRDSGFRLDEVNAAIITAKAAGIHPLEVWIALPSLTTMAQIARGEHPAATGAAS